MMTKKLLAAAFMLVCMSSAAWCAVSINEAAFPDAVFREYVRQFDTDNNGTFSDEEISAVENLQIHDMGITSLKGIEYFTSLRDIDCSRNNISELDISHNVLLEFLGCENNALTALDVSNNPHLRIINLNNLIDGSNDDGTDHFSEEYSRNNLTALDVSNNPELQSLVCWKNKLTKLDVSKNKKLTNYTATYFNITIYT